MKNIWLYIVITIMAISLIVGVAVSRLNSSTTQTSASVDEINSELEGLKQ